MASPPIPSPPAPASPLPAAPGGPPSDKLKPGIGGYLVGGAILGGAIVVAGVLGFLGLFELINVFDDFDRVALDEPTELQLDIGTYDIYLVGDGVDQGTDFTASDLLITDPDGNARAVVVNSDAPLTTTEDTYAPRLTFDAPTDGTYTFEPGPDAERSGEVDELAVGPEADSLIEVTVPWFIAAGLVGLIGGTIGTILLIVTGVRRGRAKRARRGWGPGQPGGPGAPVPGPQRTEVVEGSWAASTPSVANTPPLAPVAPQPQPQPPMSPPPGGGAASPADPWATPGSGGGQQPWGAPPGSTDPG